MNQDGWEEQETEENKEQVFRFYKPNKRKTYSISLIERGMERVVSDSQTLTV